MKKGTSNLITMIGSIVGIVGYFFNWIKIFGFNTFSGFGLIRLLLANYFRDYGVSTTAGGLFLLISLFALIAAAAFSFFVLRGRQSTKGQSVILIVLGAIVVLVLIIVKSQLSFLSVGFGFILTILGAIAVVVGGVLLMMEAPDSGPITLQSLKQDAYYSARTAKYEIDRTTRSVSNSFAQQPPFDQNQYWQGSQTQGWGTPQQQYGPPNQQHGQQPPQENQWQTSHQQSWGHQPPQYGQQQSSQFEQAYSKEQWHSTHPQVRSQSQAQTDENIPAWQKRTQNPPHWLNREQTPANREHQAEMSFTQPIWAHDELVDDNQIEKKTDKKDSQIEDRSSINDNNL